VFVSKITLFVYIEIYSKKFAHIRAPKQPEHLFCLIKEIFVVCILTSLSDQ